MNQLVFVCLLGCVCLALAKQVSKECDDVFEGCTLYAGECVCGKETACVNPYPYKNERQCVKDLKGEFNKCKKNPCEQGECVQIKVNDKRKSWCACAGSGFYGDKCQHECPPMEVSPLPTEFPVDCIF